MEVGDIWKWSSNTAFTVDLIIEVEGTLVTTKIISNNSERHIVGIIDDFPIEDFEEDCWEKIDIPLLNLLFGGK